MSLSALFIRAPAAGAWPLCSHCWPAGLAAQLRQLSTCLAASPALQAAAAAAVPDVSQRTAVQGRPQGAAWQSSSNSSAPAATIQALLHGPSFRPFHSTPASAAATTSSTTTTTLQPATTSSSIFTPSKVPQQSPLQLQSEESEKAADLEQPRFPRVGPPPTEGTCRRKNLRIGWKKLDIVVKMVRRLHVDDAVMQCDMCAKRAAVHVRSAIINARANAVNIGLNPELLVVDTIHVSKGGGYFKRRWFHGMGYQSIRESQRTHLTVTVKEDASVKARQQAKPRHGIPTRIVAPAMERPRKERQHPRPPPLHLLRAQQMGSGGTVAAGTSM